LISIVVWERGKLNHCKEVLLFIALFKHSSVNESAGTMLIKGMWRRSQITRSSDKKEGKKKICGLKITLTKTQEQERNHQKTNSKNRTKNSNKINKESKIRGKIHITLLAAPKNLRKKFMFKSKTAQRLKNKNEKQEQRWSKIQNKIKKTEKKIKEWFP